MRSLTQILRFAFWAPVGVAIGLAIVAYGPEVGQAYRSMAAEPWFLEATQNFRLAKVAILTKLDL